MQHKMSKKSTGGKVPIKLAAVLAALVVALTGAVTVLVMVLGDMRTEHDASALIIVKPEPTPEVLGDKISAQAADEIQRPFLLKNRK